MTPISIDIHISEPTPEEDQALARFFGGTTGANLATGGTTTATGGTTSGGTAPGGAPPSPAPASAPAPAAIDWFPANPGLAPFPSPEGSMIMMLDGKPVGPAYIRDSSANIINFGPNPTPNPDGYYVIYANGKADQFNGAEGDAVVIAGGKMWWRAGGRWSFLSGSGGGAGNLTTMPQFVPGPGLQFGSNASAPAGGASTGSTSVAPAMPAPPARSAIAPGSTGNIVKVGPSQTIKTMAAGIAAAQPGDTIQLDPTATFNESVAIDKPLKISGGGTVASPGLPNASFSGGAKIDGTGIPDPTGYAHQMGGLVPTTDVIIEGVEVTGFGLQEPGRGGTGGIRNNAAANVVARNCYLHDNQDGVGPQEGAPSTWLLENCLLVDNGIGDGGTHNTYFPSTAVTVTLNDCTSIQNPLAATTSRVTGQMNGGHAIKTRGHVLAVNGGYYYASDATPFDIPNGSTQPCIFTGVTIEKKAGDPNHGFLGYAMESQDNGTAGAKFVGCKFILNCDNPLLQANAGAFDFDAACTFSGNKPAAQGGTVTGLPA